MTNVKENEVLQVRASQEVGTRLNNYWRSNLANPSALRSTLEAQVARKESDEAILELVTSMSPAMHEKTGRNGGPDEWVVLFNAGAKTKAEQGPDSLTNMAIELLGGAEKLQELAKANYKGKGNRSIVAITLDPKTGLTADIDCSKGFDTQGGSPEIFQPQMVHISLPTSHRPAQLDDSVNPAAEFVAKAVRNALVVSTT